ncbi:MAG TPA: hypothetical protein VH375_03195 [Rhodanobacteraceae bacterium]|jgi:hypothetical protein
MQSGIFSLLQTIAPIASSLIIVAALVMLWRKSRSVWLIVALASELAGLVFRCAIAVMPGLVQSAPMFFTIWTLCYLVFAVGLLGYALEVNQRSQP